MNYKSSVKKYKILSLVVSILLVFYAFPNVANAKTTWSLNGWNQKKAEWASGNLQGYKEGEAIAMMLTSDKFDSADNSWMVDLDYLGTGKDSNGKSVMIVGFDSADGWFIGPVASKKQAISELEHWYDSNTGFSVEELGQISGSTVTTLRYQITPTPTVLSDLVQKGAWALYWKGHLSITVQDENTITTFGSSYWSGSSLHAAFLPNSGRMDISVNQPGAYVNEEDPDEEDPDEEDPDEEDPDEEDPDEEDPDEDEETDTPSNNSNGNSGGNPSILNVQSANFLEVHAGEIPQTGDTSNAPFAAGGLLFLLFSGLGLYGWFRKEQKESES